MELTNCHLRAETHDEASSYAGAFFLTTHPLSSPADAPTTPASPVEVPGDPWHPW